MKDAGKILKIDGSTIITDKYKFEGCYPVSWECDETTTSEEDVNEGNPSLVITYNCGGKNGLDKTNRKRCK